MELSTKMKAGIAARDVLKLIERNLTFLTQQENLPALAYMLWKWDRLQHSGRYYEWESERQYHPDEETATEKEWNEYEDWCKRGSDSSENNPKYEIGDHIEYPNEEIENLVYDAWGISVANEDYGSDRYADFYKDELPRVDGYQNPHMTVEDWMKDRDDTDGFSTRGWLLFAFGTGLKLDADGYVTDAGPSDIPSWYYNGWAHMKDKLPVEVADEFWEIMNRPECVECIKHAIEKMIGYEAEDAKRKRISDGRYHLTFLKANVANNPDYMVMDVLGSDLLKEDDETIILKMLDNEEYELSLLSDEERKQKAADEEVRFQEFLAKLCKKQNPDGIRRHFGYCTRYSLITKYKQFADCYRPHLIQGAKEFIEAGIYKHNGEEPNEYQVEEYEKMVKICKKVLKHFGEN